MVTAQGEAAHPAVCLVVGPSNGGKTTLVEKLLLELKGRSLTVATAKGHKHKIELDKVGKDSWRHRRAGSVLTFLVTEGETAAFMDPSFSSDPDMLARLCPAGVDLLLAEGFKTHKGRPKVLVSPNAETPPDEDVICVVADDPEIIRTIPAHYPCFGRDQIIELADFIEKKVLSR